ncbi:hypothetical protein ACOXXX_00695 [Thalassococcus sp. BH17M4-6]|uniref:hypothetical protein n=1 Tax=Thalassococcus sp. BH17M4-6 TaxID=3413148 RepID=UPI003BD2B49E
MTLFSELKRRFRQRAAYRARLAEVMNVAADIGLTEDQARAAARQDIYGAA